MKLYYAPGACSLSPHISLHEAGADFEIVRVDTQTHRTEDGADFKAINPKGYVPALMLESGDVVTEGAAVVQYIADRFPVAKLAPANGTLARTRLQEQLNFISSELHKAFSPLFNKTASAEAKEAAAAQVAKRFGNVESLLADGRPYLLGEAFSVADAYLFTVVNWSGVTGVSLAPWPHLTAYMQRIGARPAVRAAMQAEGLIAA
ncbi:MULTISPECIES: glutathione transferase GstA [unclassified Ensifer]|uniref:glutathione transferase GstA n=1 Tax=unclassified Ensifer TaxID=2633371 RepID=UPI000812E0CE|nr:MULTISPECIES: glutathione transferase GstA [unclassified Ensifer]OCP07120.1 glutathione transferase GstA [Ensifer sp. LC11]OCP07702.1 glutathione transferase GstA [Ensifer sp. LC13]OCP12136.1 glutathione transferase GstA [Ensifer sp. LC14]OCP31848.1 glutathione transferase GstA [Ensifer sp. LC499]